MSENNKPVCENSNFKQLLERVSQLLDNMQPSVPVKQICRLMRNPNFETRTAEIWPNSDNDEGHATVCTMPGSPSETELMKIQEKYSRRPGESVVEHVWQLSLEGGDRIMLDEEAGGYWGPGLFLTTKPGGLNYSLTAQAVYWAGGIDPQERGEPLEIRATGYSDTAAAVQKAACIQAIYERDELRKSPMLAPIDPAQLTPLICSLPDCLKTFVANTEDRIRAALEDANCNRSRSQHTHIPTWSEFGQEIDRYGRRMGWVSSSSGKPTDQAR